MQNLKIRVNSPEESERAQRAFFALGAKWASSHDQEVRHTERGYLIFYGSPDFLVASIPYKFDEHRNKEITLPELEQLAAAKQGNDWHELLAKSNETRIEIDPEAAKDSGLNSFETMVAEKIEAAKNSGWNKDGRDADEQLAELRGYATPADRHNETNPIIFLYQKNGTTKALSFKEAKEDAAKLESDGWAHIATLDAKVFVENAYRQESEAQARYDAARQYMANFPNGRAPLAGGYVDKALRIAAGLDTTE